MKECQDCEYRGYSREICVVHARSCNKYPDRERKSIPNSVKIGATTLAGAGVGVATVALCSTAVSLVGSVALIHALLLKIGAGAGLAGGGLGLARGLSKKSTTDHITPRGDEWVGHDV
jgi:hypothetical protein